jgi:hypothetical protein
MDVQIADSFTKSLKRLMWHESKVYKVYALFRYDIIHFLKNIWRFRKELWSHSWWDYRFTLNMLERSLTIMEKGMSERGIEISETREPKVKKMQRALELLKNSREDNFIDRAEQELGELKLSDWQFELLENGNHRLIDDETESDKEHNLKIYQRARQIENDEWNEMWEIFKGTKYSKKYGKKYDGTDMRGWWD